MEEEEEEDVKKEDIVVPASRKDLNVAELNEDPLKAEMIAPEKPEIKEYSEQETDHKNVAERNPGVAAPQEPNDKDSKGSQVITEPKEHSGKNNVPQRIGVAALLEQGIKDSKGWQAIPKPKDTQLWTMHSGIELKMTLVKMMTTTMMRSLSLSIGSG